MCAWRSVYVHVILLFVVTSETFCAVVMESILVNSAPEQSITCEKQQWHQTKCCCETKMIWNKISIRNENELHTIKWKYENISFSERLYEFEILSKYNYSFINNRYTQGFVTGKLWQYRTFEFTSLPNKWKKAVFRSAWTLSLKQQML